MIIRLMLMGVLMGGLVESAYAVDHSYYNASDIPRMQPYCKARLLPNTPKEEWNYWQAQIGPNFVDVHHYCAALNYMNRYWSARTVPDRSYYLGVALNNFNYMVKALKPGFSMEVELYSGRGEVFKLMGKPGEAANDYQHALSINPRIVKSYLQLASLHEAGKNRARALETITEGLRYIPDSKALQRHYLELGGKKPFPDPIVAKVAEPPAPDAVEVAPTADTVVEKETAPDASPESVAAPTEAPKQQIGTPKNPYCRFCPPE